MSEKELDEQLEFEMDDEDVEWITTKLPEQKIQLKEDKFEQIIDRLEKESFKQVARLFAFFTHECLAYVNIVNVYVSEYCRCLCVCVCVCVCVCI